MLVEEEVKKCECEEERGDIKKNEKRGMRGPPILKRGANFSLSPKNLDSGFLLTRNSIFHLNHQSPSDSSSIVDPHHRHHIHIISSPSITVSIYSSGQSHSGGK